MSSRSGKWPWRTSRWRPSSVNLSACLLSKASTSASIACASSARAPLRNPSVKRIGKSSWLGESEKVSVGLRVSLLRWRSGGFELPHDRHFTPSCRHQLSPVVLAHGVALLYGFNTPSLAAQGGQRLAGTSPWRFSEYDLVFKMRAKCPRAGTAIEVVIERGRGMLPEQVYRIYRTPIPRIPPNR